MTAGEREAARLRRCRELFERASAANVSMQEERRREARARWAATDDRLAARRAERDGEGEPLKWFQQ